MTHAPGTCPGPGGPIYTPRACWECYRSTYPDNERGAANSPLSLRVIESLRPDCYELGEVIQERKTCGAKIRKCAIFGKCTTLAQRDNLVCCATCNAYRGPELQGHSPRHLAYHIYPVMGNGAWEYNVDMLCRRLWLFNGRKIVSIVTDSEKKRQPRGPDKARHKGPTASVDQVKKRFGSFADDMDFLVMENDPNLREVLTIEPMLEKLPTDGVTLYAQAKGTTRKTDHIAHRWTQALYEVYCDHWHVVTKQLKNFPITGAFKKLGPGWSADQTFSDWHYSGSWFWFRNADLFARDWRKVDRFWSGIEPFPSQHFRANESGCLFLEGQVPEVNLYSGDYWCSVVEPSLKEWKRANAK